jgi:hypothetical protein
VDLCGGLCQPHAIFGKLAIVGLGFHGPTFLSPCKTAIPIQPARSVRETVKAGLCRIEHCGKMDQCPKLKIGRDRRKPANTEISVRTERSFSTVLRRSGTTAPVAGATMAVALKRGRRLRQ